MKLKTLQEYLEEQDLLKNSDKKGVLADGIYKKGILVTPIKDLYNNKDYPKYVYLTRNTHSYEDGTVKLDDFYTIGDVSLVADYGRFTAKLDIYEAQEPTIGRYKAIELIDEKELVEGVKSFYKDKIDIIADSLFEKDLAFTYLVDEYSYPIQESEATKYIESKGKYKSTILDTIATLKNVEIRTLADAIITNAALYKTNTIVYKAAKIYVYNMISSINSLEELEALNLAKMLKQYIGDNLSDVLPVNAKHEYEEEITLKISAIRSR